MDCISHFWKQGGTQFEVVIEELVTRVTCMLRGRAKAASVEQHGYVRPAVMQQLLARLENAASAGALLDGLEVLASPTFIQCMTVEACLVSLLARVIGILCSAP